MNIPRLALGLCLLAITCWLAPVAAAQDQTPDQSGERICIWLFWTKEPELIKQALERLAQGDPFMVVAREIAREHPKTSQANADCMAAGGMDPAVLAVAKNLRIGELSRPFDLGKGTAMVMRTTDAHRRKAQELYSKGRFAQAERELLRDLKLHPASASAWHMLALTRTAQGNYKQSLTALDKALALSPGSPAMLNDKASALANLGRAKEAIPIFENALKRDPKNPTIMSNLAWALTLAKKNPKRAVALAKKACETAPRETRVWHTLGKIQAAQGHHGEAVASLRQTLILAPKHRSASKDLVKSVKALDPKVVARLGQAQATPPADSKPKAKEEKELAKGLKPAPSLAGPGFSLPSQWPALPAAKEESKPAAKAGEKAPTPTKPVSKTGKRIVSLPMPKFPGQTQEPAKDDKQPADVKAAPEEKPEGQTEAEPQPEPTPEKPVEPEDEDEAQPDQPKPEPDKSQAEPQEEQPKPESDKPAELAEAESKPVKTGGEPKSGDDQARAESDKQAVQAETEKKDEKQEAEPSKPETEPKQETAKEASAKPAEEVETKEPAVKTDTGKAEEKKPAAQDSKDEPTQTAATKPDKPHYLIQVASYRPESLAKKELRSWERRKISGHIEKWQDRRGRTWHRVLLGPFATQKAAEKRARQLKAKRLVRDYYVVKRPAD